MVPILDHTTVPIAASLLHLGNQINHNRFSLEDIGDYIPGCVMEQSLLLMTNRYMNKQGCDILRRSKEELQNMGAAYFSNFFPAEEIACLSMELGKFIKAQDYTDVYGFFQRVRPGCDADYKWYYTTSHLCPPDQPGGSPSLMNIALDVSSMGFAGKKICKLCDDNSFMVKNYLKFTRLSKREKEIITLITRGLSSYEISDRLFISIHTVNNHRKNILSKLEIRSITQLLRFAEAFDLVE